MNKENKNYIIIENRLSDEYEPENTNDYYDDSMDDDYINKIKSGELYNECNDDNEFSNITNNKKLNESGIYPVDLDKDAIEAFEDKLSQILNGYVGVKNLELMPSYGFGGPGIYWYKCDIDLGDDVIENLLDSESTPEAYKANENNDLIIYMPSITINCSHDNEYEVYVDLDSRNESDDYDKLKNEENIISAKIIDILKENEHYLIELLKDYEIFDVDDEEDYIEESLIPINETNKDNSKNRDEAKSDFENMLQLFDGVDIKYTDEIKDDEFKTHSYVANIINTPQYLESIKNLINSDKYEYNPDFNDHVKYTEYGQITIVIEDKYITIEVMYNDDEDDYNN